MADLLRYRSFFSWKDKTLKVLINDCEDQIGCNNMAAWVKEEEKASEHRQRKREAEEANKVEVAPGVTVASLRRFRAALVGPTQGLFVCMVAHIL